MEEEFFIKAVSALVIVIVAVGVYGWVQKDIPAKKSQAFDTKIENDTLASYSTAISWILWWAGVAVVVGSFLAFGFFWDQPLWPEKAVMAPASGFIVTVFTYSVLKGLQLTGTANIIGTTTFYIALGVWSVIALAHGARRGH